MKGSSHYIYIYIYCRIARFFGSNNSEESNLNLQRIYGEIEAKNKQLVREREKNYSQNELDKSLQSPEIKNNKYFNVIHNAVGQHESSRSRILREKLADGTFLSKEVLEGLESNNNLILPYFRDRIMKGNQEQKNFCEFLSDIIYYANDYNPLDTANEMVKYYGAQDANLIVHTAKPPKLNKSELSHSKIVGYIYIYI